MELENIGIQLVRESAYNKMIKVKKPQKNGSLKNPIIFDMYVKFMSMPEMYRMKEYGYKTSTKFSKKHGISHKTLVEWQGRSDYEKNRQILMRKWGKDKTPEVIASVLRTILIKGKAPEAKLWLEFIEEWQPGIVLHTPEMVSAIKERTQLLRELVAQEKIKTKKI